MQAGPPGNGRIRDTYSTLKGEKKTAPYLYVYIHSAFSRQNNRDYG